ncbi:MAG: serpin family protein [Saprospiraceae bacterium]|nr:serpin family protein [Saprospiraceae bacterium]
MMKYLATILVFSMIWISCSDSEDPDINSNTPASLEELTGSSACFSWKMLHTLSNDPEYKQKNMVISPISIQAALYMTLNGAEGSTESGMQEALCIEHITPNGHNEAYAELSEALTDNEDSKLSIDNVVFYDDRKLTPSEKFISSLENFYSTEFKKLDFDEDTSVDLINEWADEKTEGRIKKILEEISPDEATFIINALYMKADWIKGFDPTGTSPRAFTFEDGSTSEVDMMFSDDYRSVYNGEDYKAVDLLLKDEKYSVTFILPSESSGLSSFVNDMSPTDFTSFYTKLYGENLQESRVYLTLPKFETSSKFILTETLKDQGMNDAFNRSTADFTDMGTAGGRIYLSRVLHDTYLKVDEKGVEGAAVTTVGVAVTSAPPILSFNRPYMFLIRHIDTGVIIFTGLIFDPSS